MITNIEKLVQSARELSGKYETDIMLAAGAALISLLSFAAGYLVAKDQLREPIRIEQTQSYERQQ